MDNLLDVVQSPLKTNQYTVEELVLLDASDDEKKYRLEQARTKAAKAIYKLIAPLRPGDKAAYYVVRVIEDEDIIYGVDPLAWIGGRGSDALKIGIRFEVTKTAYQRLVFPTMDEFNFATYKRKTLWERIKWVLKGN